jgi:hypothetical protein
MFEVGKVYNRRSDIHGQVGGQQRGGVSALPRASRMPSYSLVKVVSSKVAEMVARRMVYFIHWGRANWEYAASPRQQDHM